MLMCCNVLDAFLFGICLFFSVFFTYLKAGRNIESFLFTFLPTIVTF